VIYIFERDSESLRLETRYWPIQRPTRSSGGAPMVRCSARTSRGETSFRTRLDEIYTELEEDDWRTVGPPHLLQDGWKI
jgi:hypothetical protein